MADDSKQPIHPLRQRMIEDMTLRGISLASQKNYLRAVRNCCATMKKRPEDLSAEDVRSFLLHLQSRALSIAAINGVVSRCVLELAARASPAG